MPSEVKQLIGAMNLDDPIQNIGKGFHMAARNMRFRGTPPNMSGEDVPGNTIIVNSLIPGDANNLTIGRYYDQKNKRIFFFNYRSGGNDGIYIYNTINQSFQRLVEENVNADADALDFNADSQIKDIDIIYGDSVQGDILYFIDSLGVPKKINIQRALTGGYGTIKKSYMDVAKQPPDIPPYVVYENDSTNTVNSLRKKLFKIKLRWVFDDQDKSVTSSQSVLPLPLVPFDQSIDADPTKNCRLAITYQTGPANVKKIEIIGAVSLGNVFSDFFLISSIDKAVSGLSDNDIATYLFYNNEAYNYIDVQESIQLFDYVPITAGAQSILNGNVLTYGNIKEGYPNLTDFSSSSISPSSVPYYYGHTWSNLVSNQGGMSGFGSGNIHIIVRGIIVSPAFSLDTYAVYMTDGTNISYTLNAGDDASAIIEGLRVNAVSNGYNIISVGANDLIVSKAGISLARSYITTNYLYNSILNCSFQTYDWNSKHAYGLVYLDDKYRTNGVVYTSGFSVSSDSFTEVDNATPNKTKFNASIYHQPPDWAYYVQWVRTKDLAKSKFQQWVTDRTFKDTIAVSGAVKYAYLSIESLNEFVRNNPGSPLGYGFVSGDRIRFFKRYNDDNTTANVYGNSKDFEIVASLVNPTINGQVKTGQFIKIILPSTNGTFDFGVSGYDNYLIELYTPAQSVANNLNVYYEFGERYAIGNPTLSSRFHQGELQNQIPNSTPATYEFIEGDCYARLRSIQAGNVYSFNVTTGSASGAGGVKNVLLGLNFVGSTYNDPNIVAQSVPFSNIASFDPATDTRWFLKSISQPATFKFSGTIVLNFPTARPAGDSWHVYIENKYGEVQEIVAPFDNTNGGTFTFPISGNVTIENDNIFLGAASVPGYTRDLNVLVSNLTFTIDHVISQRCIDANFSDYFPSAVNSNGRAFVYNENANQVTFPTMYRWSLAYQEDTNINQTNRFYSNNFDNVERRWGSIMAMKVWDKVLTFFQERKCGWTGVYQKFISDNTGNSQLITTNDIITSNNVQYYLGDYGVFNQPQSIIQSGYVFYYIDPIRQRFLRLSKDGNTDLGETYKCQTWFGDNIPKYLNPINYPYGGKQKIIGTFNYISDNVSEVILIAQGGQFLDVLFPGEAINFNEKYNAFQSNYDFDCDQIVCAENTLYFWKNGIMYKQNPATLYNNFFGIQYKSSIELPFNDKEIIKKVFNAMGWQSNKKWAAPVKGDVRTNGINSQTLNGQESLLMEQDVDVLEAPNSYIQFNRDMNSMADQDVALWEGNYLVGNTIIVKLTYSGSEFAYLFAPYITYQIDQRNL